MPLHPTSKQLFIGGALIGLAIAVECARAGQEVFVRARSFAPGSYYPKGSRKAALCVEGRQRLYQFAAENRIAVKRVGKLIVATSPDEERALGSIAARVSTNGVDDLHFLSPNDVRVLEPEITCAAALFSPSTGIIDSHGLMLALEGHPSDA